MKSFFIPIYLKLGKLSEEKLLVALIGVTPKNILVKYSQKRIQLSEKVISTEYSQLAKEVLEQIQNKAKEVNSVMNKPNEFKYDNLNIFNSDYFEYLKKYSQNTLLFGNIEAFNFQNMSLSFDSLYESLMNEKPEQTKESKPSFYLKIKNELTAADIENKADIHYTITPAKLSGLYNNMTVTLISKNGGIFVAEAIDFNNGIPALTNSLNAFEVLINSLKVFSQEHKFKQGKYHILNSIPFAGSEQEKLLNNIYKNKKDLYKVVPEDSITSITDKIKSGNFNKFSLSL